ncbi:MAG: hypothetical protein Q9187_005341 [Circinaria calcarea]
MDGDPTVEPELDSFSLILPLPYRIAIIIVLGTLKAPVTVGNKTRNNAHHDAAVWAWAVNLHYLSILKIDVAALIKYPNRTTSTGPSHHLRTYRLATLITIPLVFSLLLFWTNTHGEASLVRSWQVLPQSYLLFLAVFFLLPLQRASKAGRYRFLSTLKRISIGGIAETQDGKFGDILLADVLTSYAKVFGDLFVSGCMLVSSKYSSTDKPDRACGGTYLVPIIISIPSVIRLRQCLIEFSRVRKDKQQPGGSSTTGWGGQHLANALKYSSAFPVIILSALQRGYDPNKIGMSEAGLFRLWSVQYPVKFS